MTKGNRVKRYMIKANDFNQSLLWVLISIVIIIFPVNLIKGMVTDSLKIEYNFFVTFYEQYYEIDPFHKHFKSVQKISIRNEHNKAVSDIFFIIHPELMIQSITLQDSDSKELLIKNWEYCGIEKIYGKYDFCVVNIATVNKIEMGEKLFLNITYTLKQEAIHDEPERMYALTITPKTSYAIGPRTGNSPIFGRNISAPFLIKIKYPLGNYSCAPGKLNSSIKEGDYIIDTYYSKTQNIPTFSCAPYKKKIKKGENVTVKYYLYPEEKFDNEIIENVFKAVELYFTYFGDNRTDTYSFATVGEFNSPYMNGENKGNAIFFSDIMAKKYCESVEGKLDYLSFLYHEIFHNWNLFNVTWEGKLGEWFTEGGANFISAWAAEKILGQDAAKYFRHQYLERFVEREGYKSSVNLEFASKTGPSERTLIYNYGALVWEQLRQKLGMDIFFAGLSDFFRKNSFGEASYKDLIHSWKKYTELNVDEYLNQWVQNNARISLSITSVRLKEVKGKYETSVKLLVEADRNYEIFTSIGYKTSQDSKLIIKPFYMDQVGEKVIVIESNSKPLYIEVDPFFRVPRINLNNTRWEINKN